VAHRLAHKRRALSLREPRGDPPVPHIVLVERSREPGTLGSGRTSERRVGMVPACAGGGYRVLSGCQERESEDY
jgi:hypothetical protein